MRRATISTILFLIVSISSGFADDKRTKIAVDLHAHRADIRQFLLRHTPIGSTANDVLTFVTSELKRSGAGSPKIQDGPATGPATKESHLRGATHLRVFLGQYYDHPEVIFLTAPMLMEKEVSAQWAFDDHKHLIEIFVNKAAEIY